MIFSTRGYARGARNYAHGTRNFAHSGLATTLTARNHAHGPPLKISVRRTLTRRVSAPDALSGLSAPDAHVLGKRPLSRSRGPVLRPFCGRAAAAKRPPKGLRTWKTQKLPCAQGPARRGRTGLRRLGEAVVQAALEHARRAALSPRFVSRPNRFGPIAQAPRTGCFIGARRSRNALNVASRAPRQGHGRTNPEAMRKRACALFPPRRAGAARGQELLLRVVGVAVLQRNA